MIDRCLREVLARLSDAQIHTLSIACQGRSGPPGGLTQVVAGGSPAAHEAIEKLAASWASTPSLTGDGIALALGIGVKARREADAQRSRSVWTGPGAAGDQRLTAAVLHEAHRRGSTARTAR